MAKPLVMMPCLFDFATPATCRRGPAMPDKVAKGPAPAYLPPGMPPIRTWPKMLLPTFRGTWELARARLHLVRLDARDIAMRNRQAAAQAAAAHGGKAGDPSRQAAMVAWFIPRIARRVPWRSDCLVQAIAAQHWLASLAIASEIVIGVRRPADSELAAHAWLQSCGMVITGGDISEFTVLLDPN